MRAGGLSELMRNDSIFFNTDESLLSGLLHQTHKHTLAINTHLVKSWQIINKGKSSWFSAFRPGVVCMWFLCVRLSDEANKTSTYTNSVLSVVCCKHLLCLASKGKRCRHLMMEVCLVGAWWRKLNLRDFPLFWSFALSLCFLFI